ncbi:MAG: zinc-binding dehydrogenase [Candidatus Komeilibacteria bacterium]|nr:zinc-binding dehydrogenase [Candidatus Komeilibacteria bacterium]
MRAIIKRKPELNKEWYKGVELVDKPEPQITQAGEVKIKVIAAAICGTDVSIYNGTEALKNSLSVLKTPDVIIGHEFCGQLIELGSATKQHLVKLLYARQFNNKAVREFLAQHQQATLADNPALLQFLQENFYVSAEMHIICHQCHQCRLGEGYVCRNTIIKGLHQDGVFASFVVVPVENLLLFALGEIPPEIIAFMDAIGNATHTVQSVEVKGKSVLVLGLGIQGLMAIAVAKAMGAAKIFATGVSRPDIGITPQVLEEGRFALAKKLGADYCFDTATPEGKAALNEAILKETDQTGVDAVLEMSGSYKALEDGFNNVRMGGVISLLGLPSGTMAVDFSKDIIFKGLTIKGVIGRRFFSTWDLMFDLLTHGLSEIILANKIVTHDLPLARFEEGFAALNSGEALKVLLRP